jgi:hypothetical protein
MNRYSVVVLKSVRCVSLNMCPFNWCLLKHVSLLFYVNYNVVCLGLQLPERPFHVYSGSMFLILTSESVFFELIDFYGINCFPMSIICHVFLPACPSHCRYMSETTLLYTPQQQRQVWQGCHADVFGRTDGRTDDRTMAVGASMT